MSGLSAYPPELRDRLPPEDFSRVVLLYTNGLRKAKWANFGTTVEHNDGED